MTAGIRIVAGPRRRPGKARILDLPAGYRDDPVDRHGLSALLAAALGDPRCGGLPARAAGAGWQTKHRLEERTSSFGYWSAQVSDLRTLRAHAWRTRLPRGAEGESLLAMLRARQTAALEHRGEEPLALIGRVLERATLGTPLNAALGTPQGIAAVTVADLDEAADSQLRRAVIHDAGHVVTGPARRDDVASWRGGLDVVVQPGAEAVVAVRVAVAGPAPAEMMDVVVEVLGNGPDGRLHHAVRHRYPLAYGFTASLWRRSAFTAIGVTATVPPEHAAAAIRVLAATVHGLGGIGPRETTLARQRARAVLLTKLDGPFGAVEEARDQALGTRAIKERLARMAAVQELPGPVFAALPPAVAAVGPFTDHQRADVARAYEGIT